MSVHERFKRFENRAKEKFRRAIGRSPAQSIHSRPNNPLPAMSPVPQSFGTSVASAPAISARLAPTVMASSVPATAAASTSATSAASTPAISAVPVSNSGPPPASPNAEPAVVESWPALGHFQHALTTASGLCGPLKLVIDDLAECIAIHEDAAMSRRDYKAFKTELETLFTALSTHFAGPVPPTMTASMDNLCSAIEKELDWVSTKEGRGTGRRLWEAKKDLQEVMECYRRIQGHLDRLTLNADLNTWKIVDEQATETRLKTLTPALSAYYDSAEAAVVRRRECTPKTREQVLTNLGNWRHDKKQGNIFWLNGMAGTGKTTIASSLCRTLERTHELGASFFCTRQLPECRNVNRILPTIAYQLARFSRPFRFALSRALERDPDVHAKALRTQLQGLIITPLSEVARALPTDLVIVIDALDECEDHDRVGEILKLLVEHVSDLPIKVFVSSRPEPQIRQWSSSMKDQLVLHELGENIVKGDIEIYFRTELAGITVSESQLADLVERAGVLFIYAATIVRYITAMDFHSGQQERLNHVLSMLPTASATKNEDIDALYSVVLKSAFSNPKLGSSDRDRMRLVLHTVVCAQEPLTISALAGLLQLGDGGWVRHALKLLWSVLHVSESGGDSLVTTLHASFPDYMLDLQRSKEHCCNATSHHGDLAELCLTRIQDNERQFNVCQLESSYVPDEQVPSLEERVNRAIPLDLGYACQYWAVHLELGGPSRERLKLVDKFLSMQLLLWMEVLNLKKRMNIGPILLAKARTWCMSLNGAADTKDLVNDAWRFTTTFAANPVSCSTPHIYVSMLACWPSSRPIAERYKQHTKRLVDVRGTAMERRELALLGVIAAGASVNSAVFSPDGMRIVSGSDDNTVRVWDAHTGKMMLAPLEGHTGSVASVAFSLDGKHIVSGSHDNTIRVWDAKTGQMVLGPLKGHTDWVNSVAFSPDGMCIVSGSNDLTIRVWDAKTGEMVLEPFEGHTDWVNSVAFSPDGTRIVSGSDDKTVRVWDAKTGQRVLGPLEGHIERVTSVAFSPDGMRIVSGSGDYVEDHKTGDDEDENKDRNDEDDNSDEDEHDDSDNHGGGTIQVWDARTGKMLLGPLKGHAESVNSVAFSPDGMHIVSGSDGETIRVWDAKTGQMMLGPLKGHTGLVNSVAFSLDGTRIVSGSEDETVRVWDVKTGEMALEPFEGHTDWVSSVAFSPDGMRIVSGSYDKTIWVWDAKTGKMVLGPLKGHTDWVTSVAFSPDGTRIVSGSDDKTIRVWDAKLGQMVLGPLRVQGRAVQLTSVVFSPDGMHIVSASADHVIRVWSAKTGEMVLKPLEGHTDSVNSAMFSPNGMYIVSSSDDGTIRVWDAEMGQQVLGPLNGHDGPVTSVALSPDSMHIVSGSDDQTIQVWDVKTGKTVLGPLEGHTDSVNSVMFSPDGTCIVSGSSDGTIQVWDAKAGQRVFGLLEGHTHSVNSVAFSPDCMYIISGSADSTIRVWQAPNSLSAISPLTSTYSRTQNHSNMPFYLTPSTWKLNPAGWIVEEDGHLLLWVPHDLQSHILVPANTFIISP